MIGDDAMSGGGSGLLRVDTVDVAFGGVQALSGASLTVDAGSIRGIVGPNGSGKTTLLNVISRVVVPQHGQILFNGNDLLRLRPHRLAGLGITRTFQTPVIFRGLTVFENVLVGLQPFIRGGMWNDLLRHPRYKARQTEATEIARRTSLDVVGLTEEELTRPVTSLNFAQQRRTELARALASEPRLLLLDEPAAGLSEDDISDFASILRHVRNRGATIIIVEHNVQFIRGIADLVTVLDHGAVLAEGDPDSVFEAPNVRAAYMGSYDPPADTL
jgi:ABC-type branched-subunit amino acid transport system ATPase component